MPAATINIVIDQGATWRYRLLVKAGPTENAPVFDLTGYSARMQLRTEVDSAQPLIELSSDNGRITITPLTGAIDMYISAADSSALSFVTGVYDLEIESAGGEVTRLVRGTVKLIAEVTR